MNNDIALSAMANAIDKTTKGAADHIAVTAASQHECRKNQPSQCISPRGMTSELLDLGDSRRKEPKDTPEHGASKTTKKKASTNKDEGTYGTKVTRSVMKRAELRTQGFRTSMSLCSDIRLL